MKSIMLTCGKCGIGFKRKPSYIAKFGASKFCSLKCRLEHNGEIIACETCGKDFRRVPSQRGKRYCSSRCYGEDNRALITVQCAWPGCTSTLDVWKSQGPWGGKRGQKRVYCTDCRERVAHIIGKPVNMQGFGRIFAILGEERASRVAMSDGLRVFLFIRANSECQDCHKSLTFSSRHKEWHIDHVVPVGLGGLTAIENLQILCRDCHKQKTTRELSLTRKNAGCPSSSRYWQTHYQKDQIITDLRSEVVRLKAYLANYIDEEETCA